MTLADPGMLWTVVAVVSAGTLLLRASFLTGLGRRQPPQWALRILRLVPAAVLSALAAPALIPAAGAEGAALASPRLWAGLLAGLIAWRTRSVLLTIGAGMLALWALQAFSKTG